MDYPIWLSDKGEKVTCVEKIKVMEQNLDELLAVAQDAFEDGILMGISAWQLKQFLVSMMLQLKNPYAK